MADACLQTLYSDHAATIDFLGAFMAAGPQAAAPDVGALLGDPAFGALEAAVTGFNPFVAMGLDQREVPHSNFLAFLLTPGESHGLGDTLLHALLPVFAGEGPGDASLPEDIVVLREHPTARGRRIDVLAYDRRRRRIGIIELKMLSREGQDQRRDYRLWAVRDFPRGADGDGSWACNLVYLTNEAKRGAARDCVTHRQAALAAVPDAAGAEDAVWHDLSYARLSAVLVRLAMQAEAAGLAGRPQDAIRQYVDFLGVHVCPAGGCHAPAAGAVVARHGPAIAALLAARAALRRDTIGDLAPVLETMGLRLGAVAGKDGYPLDPVEGEDWRLPGGDNRLLFRLNLWNDSPAFCIRLARKDDAACTAARALLDYAGRREGRERVMSWNLSLPSRRSPFPLTLGNRRGLVDHLALELRAAHDRHMRPGRVALRAGWGAPPAEPRPAGQPSAGQPSAEQIVDEIE